MLISVLSLPLFFFPVSAPPSPAWQAGASPFVLNKVDPVLYEAASNLKVTNPLDDKQSEPSISNPLSETSSGQQSASLSQLSVSELVGGWFIRLCGVFSK